jgi:hypothetical protein
MIDYFCYSFLATDSAAKSCRIPWLQCHRYFILIVTVCPFEGEGLWGFLLGESHQYLRYCQLNENLNMRSHIRRLIADSSFHLHHHLNSYHWYLIESENLKMKGSARSFEKAMNLTMCVVIEGFAKDCCRIQEVLLLRLCWCLPQ